MLNKIETFFGQYRFLSNFWPAATWYDGILYPTSEHAYQAAKSASPRERQQICNCQTPQQAKALGKKVKYLRKDWDKVKYTVMHQIVTAKFENNPSLATRLKETGDAELIEGNTWGDVYWGVCDGVGENNLGKILMDVRDKLNKMEGDH